ncbi:hypothetical protein P9112_006570 [Eukaryota sp. TZLM1-RC]
MQDLQYIELPPFVDDEILSLHKQYLKHEEQIANTTNALEEIKERFKVLSDHKVSVEHELDHTKQVLAARNQEVATEEHLIAIASREKGKLESEIKTNQKEIDSLRDRMNVLQNDLFRATERLDKFRDDHHFNQQQLDQWFLAAKQKDEDSAVLSKYTAVDAEKEKELIRKIEKNESEIQAKNSELDQLLTDTKTIQIELERTAEDFKTLHNERKNLVEKWDEVVNAMGRRDVQIKLNGEQLLELRHEKREVEGKIKQREKILQTLDNQNDEYRSKIELEERRILKLRGSINAKQEDVGTLKNELLSLENTLNHTKGQLNNEQLKNESLKSEIQRFNSAFIKKEKELANLNQQLESHWMDAGNKAEKGKKLEDYLKDEQGRLSRTERELETLRKEIFELFQKLFNLKNEEATLLAEISGTTRAINNLESNIHKLDIETSKQEEIQYSVEFQIQMMERKVSRASGQRSDEEKRKLSAKIESLEAKLEEVKEREKLLKGEVNRVESHIRTILHKVDSITSQHEKLEVEINELELNNSALDKEYSSFSEKKNALAVEHDLLEMKLESAQKNLDQKADAVSSLENKLSQLRISIEERVLKINLHLDNRRFEQRCIETERQKLASELNEKLVKIEKLKKKKEVIESRVDRTDDSGEKHSQAYLIVANAQKREELQRLGDHLDQEIKKAVKDLQQLEQLSFQTEDSNSAYKRKLMGEDELTDNLTRDLQTRAESAVSQVNALRREKLELEEELSYKQQLLLEIQSEHQELSQEVASLKDQLDVVKQKISTLNQQLSRSENSVSRLSREHRSLSGGEMTQFERNLFARQFKTVKKEVCSGLIDLLPVFNDPVREEIVTVLNSIGVEVDQ